MIQIPRSVHRGPRVCLGDDQQVRLVGHAAHIGRQTREGLGERLGLVPLHAEPGLRDAAQLILTVVDHELVLAVSEEREVVVRDPFEKRHAVLELVGGHRRRVGLEVLQDLVELRAHRAPVLHRRRHVPQHDLDVGDDALEDLLIRLPIDLEMHDGLGERAVDLSTVREHFRHATVVVAAQPHDRMDDEMRGQPASIQRHAHRVHQERHVVGGDLDDGVRRLPPMLLELGIVDTQLRRARRARAQEVPMGERRSVQVCDLALHQVLVGGAGEILADELLDDAALGRAHVLAHLGEHGIDQLLELAGLTGHGVLLPGHGRLQTPW